MSISSASHFTLLGFSALIASQQNDNWTVAAFSVLIAWKPNDNTTHTLLLSIKRVLLFIRVCFVFYSTSTKALLDMNANDELTARVAKMVALLNLRHCPSQSCSKTKWKTFHLRSAPSSNNPVNGGFANENARKNKNKSGTAMIWLGWKHVKCTMFEGAGSIWKALLTNLKPPLSSCKVNSQDIQTQPFPTVCYSHLLTKGHSKGTGAWQKIIQSL